MTKPPKQFLTYPVLIGDIGGTNARFCIIKDDKDEFGTPRLGKVADSATLFDLLTRLFKTEELMSLNSAIIAVAGPKDGDCYELTNADWSVSAPELKQNLNLTSVMLINDFSAQALAGIFLGQSHRYIINSGQHLENAPQLVVGPGTGLGVATVIESGQSTIVVPGEGGHMDLGPRTAREYQIWPHLKRDKGRVSAELCLSGRGLENLFKAIEITDLGKASGRNAAQISSDAMENLPVAAEAVGLFATLLGRVCGDLALITLPFGGVHLAGGIVEKLPVELLKSHFLPAFLDKAPHEEVMKDLPVSMLVHPQAALQGMTDFIQRGADVTIQSSVYFE